MKNLIKSSVENNSERIYINILESLNNSGRDISGIEGYLSVSEAPDGGARISFSRTPIEEVEREESRVEETPTTLERSFSKQDFIDIEREDIIGFLDALGVWKDSDAFLNLSPERQRNEVYATKVSSENSTKELFFVNMLGNYTIDKLITIIDAKTLFIERSLRRKGN